MTDSKTGKALPACPVETTLMLIGDKWKVLILRDLMPGTKRFGELKIHRQCISEGTYRPAEGYGRKRSFNPKGICGGASPRGIYAYRSGLQPEARSGCHEKLGRRI